MRKTTRTVRHGVAVAGVVAMATVGLVGCGGSDSNSDSDSDGFTDESADDIVSAGVAALYDAESAHFEGSAEDDGDEVVIDLSMDQDGNCTGSITTQGYEIELLTVDGEGWYKAGTDFWEAQGAGSYASDFADTWVIDTDSQVTGELCDLESFLDQITDGEDALDDAEKGDTVDTDQGEAIEVSGTGGSGEDVTVQVLTSDPHYIVSFVGDNADLTASEFGEAVDVEAPDESDVIDPDNFTG